MRIIATDQAEQGPDADYSAEAVRRRHLLGVFTVAQALSSLHGEEQDKTVPTTLLAQFLESRPEHAPILTAYLYRTGYVWKVPQGKTHVRLATPHTVTDFLNAYPLPPPAQKHEYTFAQAAAALGLEPGAFQHRARQAGIVAGMRFTHLPGAAKWALTTNYQPESMEALMLSDHIRRIVQQGNPETPAEEPAAVRDAIVVPDKPAGEPSSLLNPELQDAALQTKPSQYLSPDTEAELARRASMDDTEAFAALFRHYQRLIASQTARRLSTNARLRALSEDAMQHTFAIAWSRRARLGSLTGPNAWIKMVQTIASNHVYNLLKTAEHRYTLPFGDRAEAEGTETSLHGQMPLSVEEEVVNTPDYGPLYAALRKLSPNHHQLLFRRFILEQSTQEAAEALGISYNAAKQLQLRALSALRDHVHKDTFKS